MHSQLVAALFLAHKAVMALDIAPLGDAAGAFAATATTDGAPAPTACNVAFSVIEYCYSSISDFNNAPVPTIAACICCESTTELDSVYSSCAALLTEFAPTRTHDYTVNSQAASFCSAEFAISGDICAPKTSGTLTAPASTSATPTDYPPTTVSTVYATSESSAEDTTCSTETASQVPYPSSSAEASYPAESAPQDTYPVGNGGYPTETVPQNTYPVGTGSSYPTETASQAPYPTGTEGSYPSGYPSGTDTGPGAATSSPAYVVSGAVAGGPLAWAASFISLALSLYVLA